MNLADGTNLIAGVARNTDVVTTLESELNVADLEDLATTFFGVLAGRLKHLVNEVVGDIEDGLRILALRTAKFKERR